VGVGKIALFGKALVCVALPMCAMWVGFPSSLLRAGRKKQNKFPSKLHYPVKKLNPFLFQFYLYCIRLSLSFYTLAVNVRNYMQFLRLRVAFLSNPDAPEASGLRAVNFQICTETAIDI